MLHLHHRAERAGINVPLEWLNVAGTAYGLSLALNYQIELGAEPAYLSRRTFAEIDAEPMPPRFVRLFANDVREFYNQRFLDAIELLTVNQEE